MITNAKVGMRVRYTGTDGWGGVFLNQVGTIESTYRMFCRVLFDSLIAGSHSWSCSLDDLSPISPEEAAKAEDQQRRLEYAMKYL